MTTERWLKLLRRKLADVDLAALRRQDTELLDTAEDIRIELVARAVGDFDTVTIESSKADLNTYGILNATDPQMLILAYGVAHEVLSATYRQRVDRGELGVSWTSGLESESSISAEKAYKGMLDKLEEAYNELLITYQSPDTLRRIQ
jgi:hypothetical protein